MMDKIHRKQKRKQAQYLKQEPETDAIFQEEPSTHIFIGNGGLKNGVPREILEHILNQSNLLKQLYLPSGKDYAFATFMNTSGAREVVESLNGVCVQDVCKDTATPLPPLPQAVQHGPPVHLYFSYTDKVPSEILKHAKSEEAIGLPPGLLLVQDFILEEEEEKLLKFFTFLNKGDSDYILTSNQSTVTGVEQLVDEMLTHMSSVQCPGDMMLNSSECPSTNVLPLVDEMSSPGHCVPTSVQPTSDKTQIESQQSSRALQSPEMHVDMVLKACEKSPYDCTASETSTISTGFLSDNVGMAAYAEQNQFTEGTHQTKSVLKAPQSPCRLEHHSTEDCSPPRAVLKNRRVIHFGYEFLYGSNLVDPANPLPGGLPCITHTFLERMVERGLVTVHFDQLTVNQYSPGAGIPSHVDTHSVFQGPIVSLSLGSQVVMEFKHPDGRKVPVFLSPRSLLVMTGEARYLWSHGIPARKYDEVSPGLPGYHRESSRNPADHNVLPRGTRTSLTFRKIRGPPSTCTCNYPLHCDSVGK